jgi:tripartite-type tricarboxylate transporter receptor subunit TctC
MTLAAGQLAFGVAPLRAQWLDASPLRIVVPFSAGSQTDVLARLMAPLISGRLNQAVIVEDRPGASGILGAQTVLADPPTGNSLLFVSGAYAVLPVSGLKLPYDPAKDFEAVAIVARSPLVLVASKATGFKSLSDLLKAAREKPDALTFASSGIGSSTHLNAEYFAHAAGFKALHIPLKGGPDMLNEILANRIDFAFLPPSDLIGFGPDKVTQLGVTGRQRVPLAPAAPPIAESGLPGFEYFLWQALLVKSQTPAGRLADLHASIIRAVDDPEVTRRFHELGIEALKLDLKGSRDFIAQQLASTAELVRSCNLRLAG